MSLITNSVNINGFCEKHFEPVKKAFIKNFNEDLEVDASLTVILNGKFIINIWAGYADTA